MSSGIAHAPPCTRRTGLLPRNPPKKNRQCSTALSLTCEEALKLKQATTAATRWHIVSQSRFCRNYARRHRSQTASTGRHISSQRRFCSNHAGRHQTQTDQIAAATRRHISAQGVSPGSAERKPIVPFRDDTLTTLEIASFREPSRTRTLPTCIAELNEIPLRPFSSDPRQAPCVRHRAAIPHPRHESSLRPSAR
jgi:hypothetical protein